MESGGGGGGWRFHNFNTRVLPSVTSSMISVFRHQWDQQKNTNCIRSHADIHFTKRKGQKNH